MSRGYGVTEKDIALVTVVVGVIVLMVVAFSIGWRAGMAATGLVLVVAGLLINFDDDVKGLPL